MVTLSQYQSIVIEAHDSDPYHTESAQREEDLLHPSLHHLPLEMLLQEAGAEISRFRGKQPTSNVAAFEVFRRALLLRDERAWAGLYRLYAPLVEAWLLLHNLGVSLHRDELDGLVNETFAKFAAAISADRWPQFAETRKLLAYLKCCATTVATDAWRQQQRWRREVSLEAIEYEQPPLLEDHAERVLTHLLWHDLWQAAAGVAADERERLILHQHYGRGVPLRELPTHYPEQFPTIQSVYRSKHNLLQRLRRSRAVQQAAGLDAVSAGCPTKHPTTKRDASQKGTTR